MRRFMKLLLVFTVIAVLGAGSAAYAATARTPAEIAAGLTGKSVEALCQERAAGQTYGAIAKEAGKLEEFKTQMLEQKKIILDQRVAEGKITQEQADAVYNNIKNNQASCNGDGNAQMGKNAGLGLGQGNGMGNGKGYGLGTGSGAGMHNGSGSGLGQGRGR